LGDRELPIVLVGTENVVGQYRHQSKIDCFLDDFVHGSPRNLGSKEIHRKAWSIVEKRQEKRIREEIGTVAEALLDLAAYYGWTRGSRVYAVPQSKIPGGRVAAGIVHLT
jgi:hypothetical protein